MDYFHIDDKGYLRKINGFQIIPGKHETANISAADTAQTSTGKAADSFRMPQPQFMKSDGFFIVMDENAVIYDCVINSAGATGDKSVTAGIVKHHGPAPKRRSALKAIAEARKAMAVKDDHLSAHVQQSRAQSNAVHS